MIEKQILFLLDLVFGFYYLLRLHLIPSSSAPQSGISLWLNWQRLAMVPGLTIRY